MDLGQKGITARVKVRRYQIGKVVRMDVGVRMREGGGHKHLVVNIPLIYITFSPLCEGRSLNALFLNPHI